MFHSLEVKYYYIIFDTFITVTGIIQPFISECHVRESMDNKFKGLFNQFFCGIHKGFHI